MTDHGIGFWVRKRRIRSADAAVMLFEGSETSYSAFADRALRLAGAFSARGIGRGDRIA